MWCTGMTSHSGAPGTSCRRCASSCMADWYEIKDRGMMGDALEELKEMVILGRTLRWREGGLEYEADIKRVKELMEAQGLWMVARMQRSAQL